MNARDFLGSVPFFSEVLSGEELDTLAAGARRVGFDIASTLIREGGTGDSMLVIMQGTVTVSVHDQGGDRAVATLGADDIVGEMSLLTGARRAASVSAQSPVIALEIDPPAIQPLLAAKPELFDRFAEVLEKRQAELDHLYGPGIWPFTVPRHDSLAVIIRTFFSRG